MEFPKCCGKQMKLDLETIRYIQLRCETCGDMVVIKRGDVPKPIMLDD
jgi:DNA-directed RNA polymerase subunit RPC12/RpoP